eukprot:1269166-Rhodomonas_salina.1
MVRAPCPDEMLCTYPRISWPQTRTRRMQTRVMGKWNAYRLAATAKFTGRSLPTACSARQMHVTRGQ